MPREQTPGETAYCQVLASAPLYHDGTPRKTWEQLPQYIRASWERVERRRAPTPTNRSES